MHSKHVSVTMADARNDIQVCRKETKPPYALLKSVSFAETAIIDLQIAVSALLGSIRGGMSITSCTHLARSLQESAARVSLV